MHLPHSTILHADLDAFYASVKQLLDPSLRGKPIAVGGGVVLAASYEAKSFGVTSGMSGWRARELCPQLISVDGHFQGLLIWRVGGDLYFASIGHVSEALEAALDRKSVV